MQPHASDGRARNARLLGCSALAVDGIAVVAFFQGSRIEAVPVYESFGLAVAALLLALVAHAMDTRLPGLRSRVPRIALVVGSVIAGLSGILSFFALGISNMH